MSGSQIVSPFGDPNILYKGLSGEGLIANQNALLQQEQSRQLFPLKLQGAQQDLAAGETEAVARAAGGLLTMPEDQAAAAYPQVIAGMRAQGYKLANAPATYPGHTALQGLFQRGMSVPEQINSGMYTPPELANALRGIYGGGGQQGAAAPVASGGSDGSGVALGMRQNNPGNLAFAGQPNAQPGQGNRFATFPDMPTGVAATANQLAMNQTNHGINTVRGQVTRWVSDPKADLGTYIADTAKALGVGPDDPIDWTNPGVQAKFILAQQPHESGGGGAKLDPADVAKGVQMAAGQHGQTVQVRPAVQQAAAAPQMGAGVAARTGGVDVAGPGAPPPSAAPGAAVAPPDLNGPRPLPPVGAGAPVPPTPQALANTPSSAALVPSGPGINPVLAGQPSATALSPPNALAPPAAPPQATAPGTGTNSPQFQAALALQNQALELEARFPNSPQAKAAAAALRQRAALYMQADSVSYDPTTGIGTKAITGERLNAAIPNAKYEWDDKQGAYVDRSGTHPPVTPPSPRLTQTPGGDIIQSKPGGGAAVVYTTDPERLAAQEAARAEGAASGKATAEALPKMVDQGRSAAQAEGNIDYGLSQLDRARAGGINTGYFSGALTTAASAAKSLGIPPQMIGIDPSAIGNIQTARKTLSVVSGAILQQILGPGSPITDSKIEAFIHAQPGIETDPDAVRRVLAWARSQFTYEREMAQAAVGDAASTGRLPTGWQAKYYKEHGFAPIYNPGTGEMQQPDGGVPGRTSPTTPAAAVPVVKSDADFHALPSGAVFTDPNGNQRRKP